MILHTILIIPFFWSYHGYLESNDYLVRRRHDDIISHIDPFATSFVMFSYDSKVWCLPWYFFTGADLNILYAFIVFIMIHWYGSGIAIIATVRR